MYAHIMYVKHGLEKYKSVRTLAVLFFLAFLQDWQIIFLAIPDGPTALI